jgi:hypothetical protein
METKVNVVGSTKTKDGQKRRPRIRLAGFWLEELGFTADCLATVESEEGQIIIRRQGTGLDTYKNIVKQVRTSQTGLLQVKAEVHNKKRTPHLEVKGFWLEELGFHIGSIIVIQATYGLIKILLLNLDELTTKGLL